MNIKPQQLEHWTDDQLIAHLYGAGPDDRHLEMCEHCLARIATLRGRQDDLRLTEHGSGDVSPELLAEQRRRTYRKLSRPVHGGVRVPVARWASVVVAALALGAGALYYGECQQQRAFDDMVSDAQLAQDVSVMSDNPEAQPTAPLQALFEE